MGKRKRAKVPSVQVSARNLRAGMFITGHGLVVGAPSYRVVDSVTSPREAPLEGAASAEGREVVMEVAPRTMVRVQLHTGRALIAQPDRTYAVLAEGAPT